MHGACAWQKRAFHLSVVIGIAFDVFAIELPYECPKPCNRFQMVWAGDVSLNVQKKKAYKRVREIGEVNVFAHVREALRADYLIGNAEAPITSSHKGVNKTAIDSKMPHWTSRMEPSAAKILRSIGFDAMGLANNHAWDYGEEGLHSSRKHLQEAGIKPFGTGDNLAAAQEPLLVDSPFGKIGVIALASVGKIIGQWIHEAGQSSPGPVFLTKDSIARGAKLARQRGAKWIVGFVHWGKNYYSVKGKNFFEVTKGQTNKAKYFVDNGYDLVVGAHPHIAQKVERVGKTLIIYSLGNLLHVAQGAFTRVGAPGYGLLARTYLGPEGFEGVEFTCLSVNNRIVDYQTRICTANQSKELFTSVGGIPLDYGAPSIRLLQDQPVHNLSLHTRRTTKARQERAPGARLDTRRRRRRRSD